MKGETERILEVKKVKAKTIFKLLFIGTLIPIVTFGTICGIFGFFNFNSVRWNNEPIHGIAALFAGPIFGLLASLALTGFTGSIACLGLWVFSRGRPIKIRIVPVEETVGEAQQVPAPDAAAPRR